ncbi:MAG: hypothetical protein A2091_05730 [Desulfuromonadales bacterium GWD2_61_12]|nr:MAG: hypothetical protein A2091_05730 [Desulfuromonadales bacterium GWD2_61_12]HBT83054.1 TolC family protein [Desulfuromonas sp.]
MRDLFLLVLLLIPLTAAATSVELVEAVRGAVTARPQVLAAQAQADAAAAGVTEARSRYLPRLTATETYTWTDEPAGSLFIALNQERNVMVDPTYDLIDPAAQTDFATRLTLEQKLFDAAAGYAIARARAGQAAAQAGARWSREEAAFAAFQAYLEVQRTAAALIWVEKSQEEAAEILRVAVERRRAGLGLKSDELRSRVQLAETERQLLTVRNDQTLSRRRLALAMGNAGGEVDIARPLSVDFWAGAAGGAAAGERADLHALSRRSDAAALALQESRAGYLPTLGVAASYGLHGEESPFAVDGAAWAVGAELRWELFDGLRRSGAAARAAAEEQGARAEHEEARRRQQHLRAEAQLRAEEATLQHVSALAAVAAAEEGQRLLLQRYEAGLVELAELLGAQSALDRARFAVVSAESRLLLARGNIRLQNGTFLTTILPGEEVAP